MDSAYSIHYHHCRVQVLGSHGSRICLSWSEGYTSPPNMLDLDVGNYLKILSEPQTGFSSQHFPR